MKNTERTITILDTETANFVDAPIPYDVGYQIINPTTGEVKCRRSFVLREIFTDKELMSSAYYAKKIPQYWEDIKAGKRILTTAWNVRKQIAEDFKEYNVDMVGAYNMEFDRRSTNNGIRYITASKIRWFFPYGVELFDIWNMACTSFLRSKHFIKWALKNGYVSNAGNIQTSAEVAYKYITKNNDFVESHTGLEDVEIETAIYLKVLKCKMKFDSSVTYAPWRVVQEYRKSFGL